MRKRLAIYHETTEVLKAYYEGQQKLRLIDGKGSIEETFAGILAAIGEKV